MEKIKRAIFVSVYFTIILGITSCAYTFMSQVIYLENGEAIKVTLETTSGYEFVLYDDGRLAIKKGNQEVAQGGFLTDLDYSAFLEGVEILEANPEDSPNFYFFQFNGENGLVYGFLQKIEDSVTSFNMFMDSLSLADAQELTQRLHFEKAD